MAHTADTPCGAGDYDSLGVESPVVVPPPDPNMNPGASCRRPLSRRLFDIPPMPSPLIRSKQGEMYRDHQQHHQIPDENIRSPRFHLPRKRSRHCYTDDEGSGTGGRFDDGRHTQELGYPTSCETGRHYLGGSKRNFSPHGHVKINFSFQRYSSASGKSSMPMKMSLWDDGYKSRSSPMHFCEDQNYTQRDSNPNDHGKRSLRAPMEMSPWDDGYYSPTSSTCCEDEQYIQSGSVDDNQDGTSAACYDDSGIVGSSGVVGRESNFTVKEDSAYDALVDDFMAAASKSCYNSVPDKTIDEEAYKQTNRFAELALKRYNKDRNNKVKYALVEATVSSAIFEDSEIYAHVNFYAKAKNGPKKNIGKVLVFAELHHIGRRSNAMDLTCFRFLDESNHFCGRRHQGRSSISEDIDIDHCYACSDRIKHPAGSCYKAGHVVDMLCYRYD